MGKILYLECNSGISGDMTVGALLDLGADRAVLEKALESLGVNGYHLQFGRAVKHGIDAFDFDVILDEDGQRDAQVKAEHFHGEEHGHGKHEHGEHEHGKHEHGEDQVHHSHHGSHIHRNLFDVYTIINRLEAKEHVKALARHMFEIVAEAESKAHGLPIDQVHFHEVGAIDSIVDIVSTAVCIDNLGADEVVVSPLSEGRGHIHCQHGILPVPVPATANIAAAWGLELRLTDNEGEMVTPTGAAIAAAVRTRRELPSTCRILKIGVGAGKRDYKQSNILRAMLLETEEVSSLHKVDKSEDSMWVLEANLDDCTGENLGFAMECLLKEGAADVWYTPIYMKKNRPAYTLSVLCSEKLMEAMEAVILVQTTTIGVRRYQVQRTVLERKAETLETSFGQVRVKICHYHDRCFFYPEYESVKAVCLEQGWDFQTGYAQIREEAVKQYES